MQSLMRTFRPLRRFRDGVTCVVAVGLAACEASGPTDVEPEPDPEFQVETTAPEPARSSPGAQRPVKVRLLDEEGGPLTLSPTSIREFEVDPGAEGSEVLGVDRGSWDEEDPNRFRTDATGRAELLWRVGDEYGPTTVRAWLVEDERVDVAVDVEVVASEGDFVTVTSGVRHTCALTSVGVAHCWGWNGYGELGIGYRAHQDRPQRVDGDIGFDSITASSARRQYLYLSAPHTCALTGAGEVYCWGWNGYGQLGTGTGADHATPTPVAGDLRFVQVRAGGTHTCARTAEGETYCWGSNAEGQLGTGSAADEAVPARVSTEIPMTQLTAGAAHTCGLGPEGRAYCWGAGEWGQLGEDIDGVRREPTLVSETLRFTQIEAGGRHTCAVTSEGDGYCWGANYVAQLGTSPSSAEPQEPRRVETEAHLSEIAVGGSVGCAITQDGGGLCWGNNADQQTGTGGGGIPGSARRPTPLYLDRRWLALAPGTFHGCGITDELELYCWGRDVPNPFRVTPVP